MSSIFHKLGQNGHFLPGFCLDDNKVAILHVCHMSIFHELGQNGHFCIKLYILKETTRLHIFKGVKIEMKGASLLSSRDIVT